MQHGILDVHKSKVTQGHSTVTGAKPDKGESSLRDNNRVHAGCQAVPAVIGWRCDFESGEQQKKMGGARTVVVLALLAMDQIASCVSIGRDGSGIPPEQLQALLDLFSSTSGPWWKNNNGWGVGDPCQANWYGVECACTNTTIT
jgi:hypothetical protein